MMRLLLFGDQTSSQLLFLRRAAALNDNSANGIFLAQAGSVLKAEIHRLPHEQRVKIPNFLKLLDLVIIYEEQDLKIPELESAFLTIYQISWFLR